ncbi:TPA: deoxyribonuclease IV [Candidatus Poribacteria bacterium]|nr:deoxyribonuclease IV [Candidatus Poribacteria bacterium]HEX30111.1 deoxyribonuclease IV [Candidatus Poribacteria bacterium]
MLLGAHVPAAGGLHKAIAFAEKLGCQSIQIFTRSPRSWRAKPLTSKEIDAFREAWRNSSVIEILGHDCYLTNLASPKPETIDKSVASFVDQMERCQALGIRYLVTHLGSHLGSGEEEGLKRFVENLSRAVSMAEAPDVIVLLETTAGQGTNLGYTFEQIRYVLDAAEPKGRYAVCYDTCHTFAAGYDITTPEGYNETLGRFEDIIGLEKLKAFHLNDSKFPSGSRKDRHEHIGEGMMGLDPFRMLLNDDRFSSLPGVLETPDSLGMFERNLEILRGLVESSP